MADPGQRLYEALRIGHAGWAVLDSDLREYWASIESTARRQAAEDLRAWGEEGHLRRAVDQYGAPLHQSPFYMYEDADRAADWIDLDKQETP